MDITPIKVDLEGNLDPLINTVANVIDSPTKGGKKLLNALLGPWIAKREAKTARIRAESDREVCEILSSRSNEETVADFLQILQDQKNVRFLLALQKASEQLNATPDEEISAEPLDKTFFNHWQQESEIIDDDYLRTIWAKLLVEEVKNSNSISRRTLNTVKIISKEEAELFRDIAFACNTDFSSLLMTKNNGVTDNISQLITLCNAGLLLESQARNAHSFQHLLDSNGNSTFGLKVGYGHYLISSTTDANVPAIPLTTAGTDLLRIISYTPDSDSDIKAIQIAKSITNHCVNQQFKLARIKLLDETGFYREDFWDSMNDT